MGTAIKILMIVLSAYIADLLICLVYSAKKKKKDYADYGQRKVPKKKSNEDNICISFDNKNCAFLKKAKQLLSGWVIYRVKRLGHVPCQKYRIFILKHVFKMNIGSRVVIYAWHTIRAPWNISIGEGSVIGDEVILDGRNFIKIGRNVNVSTGVNIYTEQHDINDPYFRSLDSGGDVVIGDRAWISSHSTILPNVYVGEGAVLAAGAVAAKSLDAFGVYGGIPAKRIGERIKGLLYEFKGEYLPFI